jgi:hypothetical protein
VTLAARRAALALAFTLLACGGGGGGSEPHPNAPPTATPLSLTTAEDTPVSCPLAGSDPEGESLAFAILVGPAHGTLSGTAPSLSYTPDPNFHGSDSFTFTVSDAQAVSEPATASITITPVNDPPAAADDVTSTPYRSTVTVDVLANDSDVDGDSLSVIALTQPAHGTAALVPAGVRYVPSAFSGADAFTYTLSDGQGGAAVGTVTLTVGAPPSVSVVPLALSFSAAEDGPDPAAQQATVANSGASMLRFTAHGSAPWLDVWPQAGSAAGDDVRALQVSAKVARPEAWTGTTSSESAPSSRYGHTAVWTGREMIAWGGRDAAGTYFDEGHRYDPALDIWLGTISAAGAPSPRNGHSSVWTGEEMIVWGGDAGGVLSRDGGGYDPVTDAWRGISTEGAPSARENHSAVWTGSRMIVWGGYDGTGRRADGAAYDPATDGWTPITAAAAPSARERHSAVFTGTAMVVWGGYDGMTYLASGASYDPALDVWSGPLPTAGAPSGRSLHRAIWTGEEMVVWGGQTGPIGVERSGGRYAPGQGWRGSVSADGATMNGLGVAHSAVWTGRELIAWGGYGGTSGARYVPPISLGPGTWHGTVTVADPASTNQEQTLAVTLDVAPVEHLEWSSGAGLSAIWETVGMAVAPDGAISIVGRLGNEAFLARYNAGGVLAWTRMLTRADPTLIAAGAEAAGVAALPDGSTLVAGRFARLVTFGPGDENETTLSSDDLAGNGFLARCAPDGALVWVRQFGGDGEDRATSVAARSDGTAWVGGLFSSTAVFGLSEAGEATLVAKGMRDAFLARFEPDGRLAWVRALAAGPGDFGNDRVSVALGSGDAAFVTGEFSGLTSFGEGDGEITFDAGPSYYDMYLARFEGDGTLSWATRSSGSGWESGRALAALGDGSVLVAGWIQGGLGPTVFGGVEPGAVSVNGRGWMDAFLARYAPDGTFSWVSHAGGPGGSAGADAVIALGDGSALVGGHFEGVATVGNRATLVAPGARGVFVARYAPDGVLSWARVADGAALADAAALTPDGGALVVTRDANGAVELARYVP